MMRSALLLLIFLTSLTTAPLLRAADPQPSAMPPASHPLTEKWRAIVENPVESVRRELGAFQMTLESEALRAKGPVVRKLAQTTDVTYDVKGNWHWTQKNPLERQSREVFVTQDGQKKYYLRNNNSEFKPSADSSELDRWLQTSIADFYKVMLAESSWINQVSPKRLETKRSAASAASNDQEIPPASPIECLLWQQEEEHGSKRVRVCISKQTAMIYEGDYRAVEQVGRSDDPLPIHKETHITLSVSRLPEKHRAFPKAFRR